MIETTQSRPWLTRGRNLVLVLGVAYAHGLLSVALHFGVGALVANRIASNMEGEFPWQAFLRQRLPLGLASVAASAITGILAALYLRFPRALAVVLSLGLLFAWSDYRAQRWFASPATWEVWMQASTSVAVGLAMPLVFLACYRRAGGVSST